MFLVMAIMWNLSSPLLSCPSYILTPSLLPPSPCVQVQVSSSLMSEGALSFGRRLSEVGVGLGQEQGQPINQEP